MDSHRFEQTIKVNPIEFSSIKSVDENNSNENSESKENDLSNPVDEKSIERQTSEETEDQGNIFQKFLSLLRQGFRQKEVRKPIPDRLEGNVENFIIILLGLTDEENHLQSLVNFIRQFDDLQPFNEFLPTLTYEKAILIVHESLIDSIEDLTLFYSIYILSKRNQSTKKGHSNLRGNYRNLKLISEKMNEEILDENDLISIESIPMDSKRFYSQLLKETILLKDNEGNLQKDFLNYCRLHYQNNPNELKLIEQFEKDFQPMKIIGWFTRNCFLQKIVQRALRTMEIDLLFKTRFVIQLINQQIKQNSLKEIVYRILHVSTDQMKTIKDNLHGFISFGAFLDCLSNKPTSIEFSQDKETILFQIQTNSGMNIEQIRHSQSNIEILLPFDQIYQINSIEEIDDHYSIISLTILEQEDEKYQELTNEMRSEIEGPVIIIQLGKLLLSNDRYLQADYLARLLFDDQSFKDNPTLLASLAAVHHLLGSHDNKQNNHLAARVQFEQSLKIFLTFVPEDNQILSATYNNIGSMYYQDDEHDQAIIYHQKALQCQLKASSPDIDAIATYSGNIGAVYLDQKKYDQALFNYKRSLQILQQSTSGGESMAIAMIYDRIASVYWRMERPDDALPFYQKALQLELKYLPEDSHKISVSYFNLSTAYAKLNRLDEAIDAAEKSVQQLLKSVPPDHPEVKENTEQLESLRRKKWLLQLYQ